MKKVTRMLIAGVLFFGVILAGCQNPAAEPAGQGAAPGTGRLIVNIALEGAPVPEESRSAGDIARTVGPSLEFNRYTVSFHPTSGGAAHEDVSITQTQYNNAGRVAAVEDLVVGTYDITVQAWGRINYVAPDVDDPFAIGTKAVAIAAGDNTAAITLGPITGPELAPGSFAYDITVPTGVETAALTITTAPGGNVVSGGEVTLNEGANTNSATPLSLAPGYYQARVVLTKYSRSAGFVEMVHIYREGTTTLTKVFTEADFATGELPTGDMGLTIQQTAFSNVNGEGDLLGTGRAAEEILIARGSSRKASITLNAPADFTDCAWDVDGSPAGTGSPFTLNAASYTPGGHTLSFRGWSGGIAQSQIVSLYVAASDEGWVYPEELAAHLADLPDGTPEDPTAVNLGRINLASVAWTETVGPAIRNATKYITLDASAGFSSQTTVSWSQLRSAYITGISLPSFLTKLSGSDFYEWKSLKEITIPEGVTSIGSNCFTGCDNLVSVTFEGNGVTSLSSTRFPGDLNTVYNAASPKAGTYVRASGSSPWTKQTL
jgi:hypothetical protein